MWALALAVIERQFKPTVVDFSLCLIGPQGTGKTTFCRALGGEWYRSTSQDVHNIKQFMESANGGTVVEFREGLQILNPETLKDFLDSESLQYRKPYDRMERTYPIRFVTIITTNDDQPLIDYTGARRILPIYIRGDEISINPLEISSEEIRRMWAKALEAYENGQRWRDYWNKIKDGSAKIMQRYATTAPPYYERIKKILEETPDDFITNEWLSDSLVREMGEREAENARRHIKKSPQAYGLERSRTNKNRGYRKVE